MEVVLEIVDAANLERRDKLIHLLRHGRRR